MKNYTKKICLFLLTLNTLCLANEGDADRLAGGIIAIISFLLFWIVFIGIVAWVSSIFDCCKSLWNKTNNFGKIFCFGLPSFIVISTTFYFIFWYAIPKILSIICEYPLSSSFIVFSIFYLSTILTGWKTEYNEVVKRKGKYSLFSRIFVSLPILPIILICWSFKNGFGKMFIKNYKFTDLLNFWKPTLTKEEFIEQQRKEFFKKLENGQL